MRLALTLFVLGIRADDEENALALYDLALRADFLDGGSYFHSTTIYCGELFSP
jgi:hypothetical protein